MKSGSDRVGGAVRGASAAIHDGFDVVWRRSPSLSWAEVGIAAAVLVVVNYALYWRMIEHGALIADDWFWLAAYRFSDLVDMFRISEYRPGQHVLHAFIEATTGESRAPRMVIGIGLASLQCTLAFLVLRLVGMRSLGAGLAALTLAVLPSLDTTRLAFAAFNETAAVALYLAGAAIAIAGVRSTRGLAVKLALHALALACYITAILTFEPVAALVPISVLLYALASNPREALWRWPADLVTFVVLSLIVVDDTKRFRGGNTSLSYVLDRVEPIWEAMVRVYSFALPGDTLIRGPLGVVVLIVIVVGVTLAIERGGTLRRPAQLWLAAGSLGLVFAVVGALPLLPAQEGLIPTFVGVNNRLTLVSSLGQVVLIVALAALGAIALASLAKRPRIAAPLAAAVLVINCGLLVRKEIQNQDPWIAAGREQDKIFAAVDAGLPNPPPGSVVVTFGHPTYIEGVPVFLDFDLGFALQLRHSEAMARESRPYVSNGVCLDTGYSSGAHSTNPFLRNLIPYADGIYFVNVPTQETIRIRNRAQCERQLARLVPDNPPAPLTPAS